LKTSNKISTLFQKM